MLPYIHDIYAFFIFKPVIVCRRPLSHDHSLLSLSLSLLFALAESIPVASSMFYEHFTPFSRRFLPESFDKKASVVVQVCPFPRNIGQRKRCRTLSKSMCSCFPSPELKARVLSFGDRVTGSNSSLFHRHHHRLISAAFSFPFFRYITSLALRTLSRIRCQIPLPDIHKQIHVTKFPSQKTHSIGECRAGLVHSDFKFVLGLVATFTSPSQGSPFVCSCLCPSVCPTEHTLVLRQDD